MSTKLSEVDKCAAAVLLALAQGGFLPPAPKSQADRDTAAMPPPPTKRKRKAPEPVAAPVPEPPAKRTSGFTEQKAEVLSQNYWGSALRKLLDAVGAHIGADVRAKMLGWLKKNYDHMHGICQASKNDRAALCKSIDCTPGQYRTARYMDTESTSFLMAWRLFWLMKRYPVASSNKAADARNNVISIKKQQLGLPIRSSEELKAEQEASLHRALKSVQVIIENAATAMMKKYTENIPRILEIAQKLDVDPTDDELCKLCRPAVIAYCLLGRVAEFNAKAPELI